MKYLLIVTAILEFITGVLLVCYPATTVTFLLGASAQTIVTIALERLAGAALVTIGIANWHAFYEAGSKAARGLVKAMLYYNLSAVFILSSAGLQMQFVSPGLWAAVIVHTIMFIWCVMYLVKKQISAQPTARRRQ